MLNEDVGYLHRKTWVLYKLVIGIFILILSPSIFPILIIGGVTNFDIRNCFSLQLKLFNKNFCDQRQVDVGFTLLV